MYIYFIYVISNQCSDLLMNSVLLTSIAKISLFIIRFKFAKLIIYFTFTFFNNCVNLDIGIEEIMTTKERSKKDRKEEYVIRLFLFKFKLLQDQCGIFFYFRIQRKHTDKMNQYRLTKYPLRNRCFLPINKIL